jgi:sugar phosphate isomerase/epimerase
LINKQSIALQLYSVREALAEDFEGTIRKIADMGYRNVEPYDFPFITAQAAQAFFDELEINVSSTHIPLPVGDKQNEVLEAMATYEAQYCICPSLSAEKYFKTVDGIKAACELLNEANQIAQDAGLTLGYHNHDFEYAIVEGQPAYKYMLEYLDESVILQLDTYWIKVAGIDPVAVIKELDSRAPLLHIKDGPATSRKDSMLALGTGSIDIPAILQASQADWHIVELDRCDTDMLEAVQQSYQYLTGLTA